MRKVRSVQEAVPEMPTGEDLELIVGENMYGSGNSPLDSMDEEAEEIDIDQSELDSFINRITSQRNDLHTKLAVKEVRIASLTNVINTQSLIIKAYISKYGEMTKDEIQEILNTMEDEMGENNGKTPTVTDKDGITTPTPSPVLDVSTPNAETPKVPKPEEISEQVDDDNTVRIDNPDDKETAKVNNPDTSENDPDNIAGQITPTQDQGNKNV
jgi:hypothetical protein